MNHLYYGCNHGCHQHWFIPWWPHGSLAVMSPGRLPGTHQCLSGVPAAPLFGRPPQAQQLPLGFQPPIVSLRNNHILKSKVRDSRRSVTARRNEWWLAEAQWDNKVSFKHLFIVQSPRWLLNNALAARLSSCYLVDWSIHCEASWVSYYEGKEGFNHFCIV